MKISRKYIKKKAKAKEPLDETVEAVMRNQMSYPSKKYEIPKQIVFKQVKGVCLEAEFLEYSDIIQKLNEKQKQEKISFRGVKFIL